MKTFYSTLAILFSFSLSAQDFTEGNINTTVLQFTVDDFNGDNYPDVLGRDGGELVFLINDATTPVNFTEQVLSITANAKGQLASGDMDADGDMDVIFAATDNFDLHQLTNDGAGNFTLEALGVSGTEWNQLGDLDNDGDMDIMGLNTDEKRIVIYFNNGDGTFDKQAIPPWTTDLVSFTLGDLDNDNDLDYVLGFDEFSGLQVRAYINDGTGSFNFKNVETDNFRDLVEVTTGDINNDGTMDIIGVSNFACAAWTIKDNGNFEKQELFTYDFGLGSGRWRTGAAGDLTGEGYAEIITGDNSDDVLWYKNNGDFTFERIKLTGVAPALTIDLADLDLDQDLDVMVTNGDRFYWFENEMPQVSSLFNPSRNQLNFAPNPTSGVVQFSDLPFGEYSFRVYPTLGQLVDFGQLSDSFLDISGLGTGVYLLEVEALESGDVFVGRVVRE